MMNSFFNNGDIFRRSEVLALEHVKSEKLMKFKSALKKLKLPKLIIFYNKVFDLISTEIMKITSKNPGIKVEFRCQTFNDGYDFESEEFVVGILIHSLQGSSTKNAKHYSWHLYQRVEFSDYCVDKNSNMSKLFFNCNKFINHGKIRLIFSLNELKEKILGLHSQKYYLLQAKFIKLCEKELRIQLNPQEPDFKQQLEEDIPEGYDSSTKTSNKM